MIEEQLDIQEPSTMVYRTDGASYVWKLMKIIILSLMKDLNFPRRLFDSGFGAVVSVMFSVLEVYWAA